VPFWIDRYEVTNAQYGSSGFWSGDNFPHDTVDWLAAQAHCQSREAHLPTEPQWEYAARGPDNLVYPWGNDFESEKVVYLGNSGGQTAPVGSRSDGKSWVGAFDMSGNVWEWMSSVADDYPYDNTHEIGKPDSAHVLRGGGFNTPDFFLRTSNRYGINPQRGNFDQGFRCARDYVEGDLS
jgi:formylglycine-generating enzyme required for sulfatase activity